MGPITYFVRMVAKEGQADAVEELLLSNPRRIEAGAVAIADTQITRQHPDGPAEPVVDFGVQKIHPVDDRAVVGFSGDIRNGFRLVDHLRAFASRPGQPEELGLELGAGGGGPGAVGAQRPGRVGRAGGLG